MVPAAFRNLYKGFPEFGRYAREGIKTRRGDVVIARDDLTTGDLLGQALGFAPTKYTLTQEINQNIKRKEKKIAKRRADILRRLYASFNYGDYTRYSEQLSEIVKFNNDHPNYRISVDSIIRSIRANKKASVKMHNGIRLNPKLSTELRNDASNFRP
jgi:hypothetical protein